MIRLHIGRDIVRLTTDSYRYLRFHVLVSTRFSRTISNIVWLITRLLGKLALILYQLALSISSYLLSFSSKITWLVLLIALVSLVKSLRPRYKFLVSDKRRSANRKRELVERCVRASRLRTESNVLTRDYRDLICKPQLASIKDELVNLIWRLAATSREMSKLCSSSVSDGNIQSIYKSLSWSSTRFEFESVYWFNHTLQSLWPSLMTLIQKQLREARLISGDGKTNGSTRSKTDHDDKNLSSAAKSFVAPASSVLSTNNGKKRTIKSMLIKERDIQSKQAKLSVFLSCRRQLELLRQRKELVVAKGDEYLGQKVAIMLVYLVKKFTLCSKQYFIEQVTWLIEFASSFGRSSESKSRFKSRRSKQVIELDLKEILRKQNIEFRLPKVRKTKSATAAQARPRVRFVSAPEFGLPCNSRRLVSGPSGLISFCGLKSLQAKRQKLAHSVNQMLIERHQSNKSTTRIKTNSNDSSAKPKRPPIAVTRLELGNSTPKITSIKYLEKEDHLLEVLNLK